MPYRFPIALLTVALATPLATPLAVAQTPANPAQMTMEQRWRAPTEPFHIIDNIHYVGTLGLSAFLFTSDEGHILLDGALPESAPHILDSIRKLGFDPKDVKYLLNSHAHFDHSGGLAELKRETGAQLVAHVGDVSALEGGFYLGSERITQYRAPPVKVDIAIEDGHVLELGGVKLVAHHTPGHSRGCTSWGMTASAYGDNYETLVFCSATVAANRITAPLQYAGIVDDYRATFAKTKSMRVDVPLAAHPEFFGLIDKRDRNAADPSVNAFIDPAAFPAFIARTEADFERLLAERSAAPAAN